MELEGREWWDFLSLVLCPECCCTPPSLTVRSSHIEEYPSARLSANPERFPQLWEQRFAGKSATDMEAITVCHLTRSSPAMGFQSSADPLNRHVVRNNSLIDCWITLQELKRPICKQ